MIVLEVHDMQPNRHVLAVDLRHVLRALGNLAETSYWQVCKAEPWDGEFFIEATGDGADILDGLSETGERRAGPELLTIADRTHQVIWGVFAGYRKKEDTDPWILIHAFDSSRYEIHTNDDVALDLIRNNFANVRPGKPREFKLT